MNILSKIMERPGLIAGAAIRRQIDFHRVIPRTALFFLTYRCDSRCETCTFWKKDKHELKKQELSLEQWKQIANQLSARGIRAVELFGGNILLRKDLLIPLLHHLHQLNMAVHIPTNQIGLDAETIEAMVAAQVDTVYLSTDGVDDSQNDIRGVKGAANINQSAISLLRQARRRHASRKPTLVCNTTISNLNYHSVEQIVSYALEQGFDEVHCEYVGEFDSADVDASLINGLRPDPSYIRQPGKSVLLSPPQAETLKTTLARIKRTYRGSPLTVTTLNIDVLSTRRLCQGTIPHSKCYMERREVTVDPAGNLTPCPFITNYSYGNLLQEGFDALWNNQRHQQFRKLQNSGQLPMCRHCILGVQRNPPFWLALRRNLTAHGTEPLLRQLARRRNRTTPASLTAKPSEP